MKTFYLTLFLFIILVGAIVANVVFVWHTADTLETMVASLPDLPETGAALAELETFWQKRRVPLSLSVPAGAILLFDTALTGLRSSAECGRKADYELYRAEALLAIRGLARLERFSAENLL